MGAKASVKLAYKSVFAPIFTSDVLNSYNLPIYYASASSAASFSSKVVSYLFRIIV